MLLIQYAPWRGAFATMASLLLAQVTPPATTTAPTPAAFAAVSRDTRPSQTVERAEDGLFYLSAQLGGQELRLMLDTGANMTVLSAKDARAAGITSKDLSYDHQLITAGGTIRAASTQLDGLEIGGQRLDHVGVIVTDAEDGVSLLGQNVLSRLGEVVMQEDRMIIRAAT
jgi:aspartyl protease family protein